MAEPWTDAPMTVEALQSLRARLQKMPDAQLRKNYEDCLEMCKLQRGRPPRAPFVQQLVQTWRELKRRELK